MKEYRAEKNFVKYYHMNEILEAELVIRMSYLNLTETQN